VLGMKTPNAKKKILNLRRKLINCAWK